MAVTQGSIAFVGFSGGNNGTGSTGFAFVLLAPLAAGDQITFTDQNWNGTKFTGTEGSLTWTVPAGGLSLGTLVQIATDTTSTTNLGGLAQTGSPITFTNNDGIFAFTGTPAAPGTFVTAIVAGNESFTGTGLTNGVNAVSIGIISNTASDVGIINTTIANTTYANAAAAGTAYNTAANWSRDGSATDNLGVDWPALSDPQSPLNGKAALPVCFLAGTMIRTPDGEAAIENLAIGDLIVTADGSAKPVKFIGRQTVSMLFTDKLKSQPILIKAGALGENLPARNLYTSPGHSMVLDGNLVIASALVNGRSVVRWEQCPGVFTYYHIELEGHEIVFAEGAATETYCDNVPREVFDNAAAYKALYPNAKPIIQLDMPTVKSQRQMPVAIKRHLAERADAIAGGVSKVA